MHYRKICEDGLVENYETNRLMNVTIFRDTNEAFDNIIGKIHKSFDIDDAVDIFGRIKKNGKLIQIISIEDLEFVYNTILAGNKVSENYAMILDDIVAAEIYYDGKPGLQINPLTVENILLKFNSRTSFESFGIYIINDYMEKNLHIKQVIYGLIEEKGKSKKLDKTI